MRSSDSFGRDGLPALFGGDSSTAPDLSDERGPVIVILGPPGSGKGTQAELLGERLGLPHISTGDMLRERILRGDSLGNRIAARIDVGQFVPDDWINQLLDERLAGPDCRIGFILDGYPRTVEQAARLVAMTGQQHRQLHVIHLLAEAADLARRFAGRRQCDRCGALFHLQFQPSLGGERCDRPDCDGTLRPRADDRQEFVQRRLADFEHLTKPVLDFLRGHCRAMVVIAASGASPAEVAATIWDGLNRPQVATQDTQISPGGSRAQTPT